MGFWPTMSPWWVEPGRGGAPPPQAEGATEWWTIPEKAATAEVQEGNAGEGRDVKAADSGMRMGGKGGARNNEHGRIPQLREAETGYGRGILITATFHSPHQ